MTDYPDTFYNMIWDASQRSAIVVIPLLMDLFQPESVIDVGCGTGTWLAGFRANGVEDILGIDGSWVPKKMLKIPAEKYKQFDLTQTIKLDKVFDLVVSLEVAEHLPNERAKTFVDDLTRLGPVILFSAAIPFQGGTKHINEQWPEYWVKYFKNKGYAVIDCLRKTLWENDKVQPWYAQNIFLFVRLDSFKRFPNLKEKYHDSSDFQLSIVHPKIYLKAIKTASDLNQIPLRKIIRILPVLLKTAVKNKIMMLITCK